ncbi:MAG: hypothetical protein M5U34_39750 [Chloroflexi bacterium]|nr:hypothetical protein [Chloroflexota bacterium]
MSPLTLPHNSLPNPKVCKYPGGLGAPAGMVTQQLPRLLPLPVRVLAHFLTGQWEVMLNQRPLIWFRLQERKRLRWEMCLLAACSWLPVYSSAFYLFNGLLFKKEWIMIKKLFAFLVVLALAALPLWLMTGRRRPASHHPLRGCRRHRWRQ